MVGTLNRQSTLFYVAFGEQAALIKDEKLDAIDVLLHDEELIELGNGTLAITRAGGSYELSADPGVALTVNGRETKKRVLKPGDRMNPRFREASMAPVPTSTARPSWNGFAAPARRSRSRTRARSRT